eukprot:c50723_g1_i1 orf=85-261(+)
MGEHSPRLGEVRPPHNNTFVSDFICAQQLPTKLSRFCKWQSLCLIKCTSMDMFSRILV